MTRHRHDHTTRDGICPCGKSPEPYPALDVLHPYAGPCWVCGGPDKRHRLADALIADLLAGDTPETVADRFDSPLAAMAPLLETAERNRRRRRYRWAS